MRAPRGLPMALLVLAVAGVLNAEAHDGSRSLLQLQGENQQLLHSMHCFESSDGIFISNTMWRPAEYYQAKSIEMEHKSISTSDVNSVLASSCEASAGNSLEFVFTVPRGCRLKVNLYFASMEATGFISIVADGERLENDFDLGTTNAGGTTVHFTTLGPESGILDLVLQPVTLDVKPMVNGIQIFALEDCEPPNSAHRDTTGEADESMDESSLVYRMACTQPTSEIMETTVGGSMPQSEFVDAELAMVTRVTDTTNATGLFNDLCMPATDADHISFELNLVKDVTYEAMLYLKRFPGQGWSDVLVTLDGKDVFATNRNMYGVGSTGAKHVLKTFEFRAENDTVSVAVSSLGGFAPISGIEVYRAEVKSSRVGKSLLDRPDGYMVVDCGSTVYKQTTSGEIVYPGTQAFSSVGMKVASLPGDVTAGSPAHEEFVEAGLFNDQCSTGKDSVIKALFAVIAGETYEVTFFWAELSAKAAGSRLMDLIIDDKLVESGVDVLQAATYGKSYSLGYNVTAGAAVLKVEISATAGVPMLSFISVLGKGVDAAAGSRRSPAANSLILAAACGAAGDHWQPLDPYMAAGYDKFSGDLPAVGGKQGADGVYRTHCFAPAQETLTIQLSVVPMTQLRIVLHFAEVYFTEPGQRDFDVTVNGVVQFPDIDIVRLAGPNQPLVREFTYVPTTHTMVIEMTGKINSPIINAVEVFAQQPQSSVVIKHNSAVTDEDVITINPSPQSPTAAPAPESAPAPSPVVTDPVAPLPVAPAPAPAAAPAPAPAPVDWKPPPGIDACIPKDMFPTEAPSISVSPSAVTFAEVNPDAWQQNFAAATLLAPGTQQTVKGIRCSKLSEDGTGADWFVVQFSVQQRVKCVAGGTLVAVTPPYIINARGSREVIMLFEPAAQGVAGVKVEFMGDPGGEPLGDVVLMGTGGNPFEKAHTLHPVVKFSPVYAQPAAMGGSTVFLDGATSHTHAPNSELVAYSFTDVKTDVVVSDNEVANCFLPFGTYSFKHTIQDSDGGAESATVTFVVAPENAVPGVLVHFYPGVGTLNPLPDVPEYAGTSARPFAVAANEMPVFDDDFVVRIVGNTTFPGGPVLLKVSGLPPSTLVYLVVDGIAQDSTQLDFPAGDHEIDIRLKLGKPLDVTIQLGDSPVSSSLVDISSHPPVINELATDSITKPGAAGLVKGFLLRPPSKVLLNGAPVNMTDQTVSSISFVYPELPAGTYDLTVERDGLASNKVAVEIEEPRNLTGGGLGGPFSTSPKFGQKEIDLENVVRVLWCHGKLYTAQAYHPSAILEYTFDDTYNVIEKRKVVDTPEPWNVTGFSKWSVLGLACDPRDNDENYRVWFSHTNIFRMKGVKPTTEDMPYSGSVYFVQPNAKEPKAVKVIAYLSAANGDHAVNGIDFHQDGRLLIAIGSHTNAGIPGALGYLPENPTAANILAADVYNPDFNGEIEYKFMEGAPAGIKANDPMDQKWGDWVYYTNPHITKYAVGTRNPFAIRVTQSGKVMATINGPNINYGETMTGVDANMNAIAAPDPAGPDAFFYDLKEDCYCGAPNLARCRLGDERECKYIKLEHLTDNFPKSCKATAIIESALGGVMEYRSFAFDGAWDGRVFISSYKQLTWRLNPKDGKKIADKEDPGYPLTPALDIIQAPGGVHISAAMVQNKIYINYPIDPVIVKHGKPTLYDISPQKALRIQSGPNSFIIGGANFDNMKGELRVLFGTVEAANVKVDGANWLRGHIPSNPAGTCETDVFVIFGDQQLTLPAIFCYLEK